VRGASDVSVSSASSGTRSFGDEDMVDGIRAGSVPQGWRAG
jgi:hypothetical protein